MIRFARYARYAGLAVVFTWFFFGGVSHFTNVDFFMAIMPPMCHIPWRRYTSVACSKCCSPSAF